MYIYDISNLRVKENTNKTEYFFHVKFRDVRKYDKIKVKPQSCRLNHILLP
jgi:hypothetical protein